MERLKNKVAIIIGGVSGIGKVTARLFAAEGAAVVITDINEPGLNLVAEEISASGGKALAVKQDVTSEYELGRNLW
jgi:NAD(P)-dependent dehydrogenase (short-subunit alcohol dehydrogenase family)